MRFNDFDFKNPDYNQIFKKRIAMLKWIRANPDKIHAIKLFYRDNPVDFINDWGCTFDPRNPEKRLSSFVPFILMPKQEEWILWFIDHWKNGKNGITEKSRTVGMSWLALATTCTLCLFNPGLVFGFGSRKQEYVDLSGDLKALFPKARLFLKNIPREFLDGFDITKHAPFMRILFPNGSQIVGESGDGIGRGGRASAYIVDEAAFLERPQLIDASLSETTNCRIDVSTPNGMANPFAEKRFAGKIDIFTYHWIDDLRRDQEWYNRKCAELSPTIIAQELDISYTSSVDNLIIPDLWIRAAIDAHIKLGIEPTGVRLGALDVADQGKDKNAYCGRHGIVINFIAEWTGKGSDLGYTAQKTVQYYDQLQHERFIYDADGLGVGINGYIRMANEIRPQHLNIKIEQFRGSGSVDKPDNREFGDRFNKDYFANAKAQSWWRLRQRFEKTYNAITKGDSYSADDLISISSKVDNLNQLIVELSYPVYLLNNAGKILIDKTPDGVKSPNCADAVMMCFNNTNRGFNINFGGLYGRY